LKRNRFQTSAAGSAVEQTPTHGRYSLWRTLPNNPMIGKSGRPHSAGSRASSVYSVQECFWSQDSMR